MGEILGSLFGKLIGLIAVGAVAGLAYTGFSANKTSTAVTDLNQLVANIQALYSTQATFTSLSNTTAINAKLAPSSMISGTTLVNPWAGTVTVAVASGNASQFTATTTNVPTDSCAKMATMVPSIVGLTINGTSPSMPVDAGIAATACSSATNTLVYTFARG